ncbi:MAG: class B sortase [Oscillospiraceae bacterium]|nr:class B sortase [Oscillospiraceae bacterium]
MEGALGARLGFALVRVPVVLLVGGFDGAALPGMATLCESIAIATGVSEADVRFRWVKDGPQVLGAEFSVGSKTVYVISGQAAQADTMLSYLGKRLNTAEANPWQRRAQAPPRAAPLAPNLWRQDEEKEQESAPRAAPAAPNLPRQDEEKEQESAPRAAPAAPNPWQRQDEEKEQESAPRAAPAAPNPWRRQDEEKEQESAPLPETAKRTAKALKKLRIALGVVLVTAALAGVVSGVYLLFYQMESGKQAKLEGYTAQLYHREETQDDAGGHETASYGSGGMLARFAGLFAKNSDIAGWLTVPGVQVDLPVVLGKDNDYYLRRNFEKAYSRYGTLFFDCRDVLTPNGTSNNLSIYGHETKSGAMFGQVKKYRNLEFYKKNAKFTFSSLFEERQYVIFAVTILNAEAAQDNGNFFDWRNTNLDAPEELEAFAQAVQRRSIYQTGVDVRFGDQLLSLTTCTYEFLGARLVLFARAVRAGEEIDVANATKNPDPQMPAAWSGDIFV